MSRIEHINEMGQALSSVVSCCYTRPARDSKDTEFIEVEVCCHDEQATAMEINDQDSRPMRNQFVVLIQHFARAKLHKND